MRQLFLFSFLVISCYTNAQLIPRPIGSSGNNTGIGFYEFRPADYNTASYKHPVIICLGGIGEEGNGTTELNTLLGAGVPYMVGNGATMRFTWEGLTQSFVVLIPQKPKGSGSWDESYTDAMIDYAALDSKLDMNRIFLSGYSLGGGGCWKYVTSNATRASKIAGIIPVAPSPDYNSANFCLTTQNKVAAWGIHALDDPAISYTTTSTPVNGINGCSPLPVKAKASFYYDGSHSTTVWTFRAADTTNNLHYPNIYQWMLKVSRSLNPATNLPPVANAGSNLVLDIPVRDKDFILDATGSSDPDDIISEYKWERLAGTPVASPTSFIAGNNFGFYILGSKTVSLFPRIGIVKGNTDNDKGFLEIGTYTFRLTVTDYKGATSVMDKVVTVRNPPSGIIQPGVYFTDNINLPDNQSTTSIEAQVREGNRPIVSRVWTQISGPQTATIILDPNINKANLSNLTAGGVYEFELVLTNDLGGIGRDRIRVTKAGAVALPVTLTYFKGKNIDQKNSLSWATSDETDNDRFEIQRSEDGINFYEIGRVAGKGNGNGITEYSFEDANAIKGVNYYRLRQVDKNGKFSFSAVITVAVSNKRYTIEQYPNPVQDVLTLRFEGNTYGNIQLSIADIQGRIVSRKTTRKEGAVLKTELNLQQLQSGVYQLLIQFENGKKETRSFVKN
jgi:hypothetical protein